MAQYDLNLRDYWRIFYKRRKTIILIMIFVTLVTYLITPSGKITYQAKTSVKVTKSSNIAGLLLSTIYWAEGSNLVTQAKLINSQSVTINAAKSLGLIPENIKKEDIYENPEMMSKVRNLQSMVAATTEPNTNIITITVTSNEQGKVVQYVNTVADAYIEENTREKNKQIIDSKVFIENQLKVYQTKLEDAEDKLRIFKEKNIESISLSSATIANLQEELSSISTRMEAIQLQVAQLIQRMEEGHRSTIDWVSVDKDDLTLQKFNQELVDLQIERERNLIYYTPASPVIKDLDQKIKSLIENIIFEYESTLSNLQKRKQRLLKKIARLPANDIKLAKLEREVKVNEEVYSLLRQKYQEVLIQDAGKIQEVTLVERATNELVLSSSKKASRTMAGFFLGLLIGLVAAFIMENLDTSIGSIEDVEEFLGVRVQGVIPAMNSALIEERILEIAPKLTDEKALEFYSHLPTLFAPLLPVSEAFYSIRTNLEFSLTETGKALFLLTSSTPDEGKTTAASNIAISMALQGRKVLLIGGDLRKPNLFRFFGLNREPGLADIILGKKEWPDTLNAFTEFFRGEVDLKHLNKIRGIDNIDVIVNGKPTSHPTDMLSSSKLDDFLSEVKNVYDIIIIDSPPILPVSDAAILASKVDGVIMLYKLGVISRNILRRAKSHIDSIGADLWGIILNEARTEVTPLTGEGKYYRSYRGYYLDEEESEKDAEALDEAALAAKLGRGGLERSASGKSRSEKEALLEVTPTVSPKQGKFPTVRKRKPDKKDYDVSDEKKDIRSITQPKKKKK